LAALLDVTLEPGCHIVIQRQCRPHIMMLRS
jgi:hypothetical protein